MDYRDIYFNGSYYMDDNSTLKFPAIRTTCAMTDKEYLGLLFTFLVSGVLGHAIFIFTFVREETMRVDANFYLINLSIAEFVFLFVNSVKEILTFTYLADHQISEKVQEAIHLVMYISFWTSVCTSMLLIVVISVDCYTMVCREPHTANVRHRRKYRSTLATRIVWFFGLGIGCVIAVCDMKTLTDAWKLGKHVFLCFLTIMPILLAIVLYSFIIFEVLRSHRFTGHGRHTEEKEIVKMCLLTTIVYIICFLPLTCYFSIGLYSRLTYHYHLVNGNLLLFCIASYFPLSIIVNFASNSLIFNFGTKQYRNAVLRAIRNSVYNLKGKRDNSKVDDQSRANGNCAAPEEIETRC